MQVLALCMAVLVATHIWAQDAGGGGASGGASGGGDSGAGSGGGDTGNAGGSDTGNSGNSGATGGSTSGGATQGNSEGGNTEGVMPSGGPGEGGEGNNGAAPAGGIDLFGPGTGTGTGTEGTESTEGTSGQSLVVPPPLPPAGLPPGSIAPIPGTTPAQTPPTGNALGGTQGAVQTPPVTLTLPGGYGGGSSKSFTLGEGRLAKPPITFTLSVSQGYDDNIFSADANAVTILPSPGPTPPLEERIIGVSIKPPFPPTPVYQKFRPAASPTPAIPSPLGVIASPVSTATVGVQVQGGTPRTVLEGDASLGAVDYLDRPGSKTDYTFNGDLSFVRRISSRMTLSVDMFAVYQDTPNFALINAPTNNGNGGNYLNGSVKADLSFAWSHRLSTVTSVSLATNLLQSTSGSDLYSFTYGTQARYMLDSRNTVTAELRQSLGTYPSNSSADTTSTYYLLGLDNTLTARLRNTVGFGIETYAFDSGGASQTLPYIEGSTTMILPRESQLALTYRYGSEDTGSATQTTKSFRTGLTLTQSLSTKLVASVSLAYNYLLSKDSSSSAGNYTQNQLQAALSLAYTVSPRLSLSLSYTYLDLMSGQVNSSYTRGQVFLGGTYTFR